jgi:PKD repeat protein
MTTRHLLTALVAASLLVAAVGAGIPAAATQTDAIRASPETAAIGEGITFSAPDVDADSYEWRFGDGERYQSSSTVTHEYLEPGTYTVALEAETGNRTVTYETTVTVEPRFANVTQVEPREIIERGSTPADAGIDVDVFAVEVPPEHHFTVASSNPGAAELRVYDADGEEVARTQLVRDTIAVGATAPAEGETYYIAAQRGIGSPNPLYLLFSELTPPDEFEPNQNRTTAELVTVDEERSGVVSAADRVDWFAVESGPGPIEVRATLEDRSADNLPNLDVGIYDPNGTYIGTVGPRFNRTEANDASSQFRAIDQAEAQTEGTYYVRVRAVSSEDQISPDSTPRIYNLAVSAPSDPDEDGRYEDVNGDGSVDVVDVQSLFSNLDTPTVRNNPQAFDFNGDGRVDVVDVQALFVESGDR